MLLLFHAGPVNISFADQNPRVDAILECFFPAQATGEALRHVLLNDVKGSSPAGRLPYTWPMVASQVWRENGGWGGGEGALLHRQAFSPFLLLPFLSLSLSLSLPLPPLSLSPSLSLSLSPSLSLSNLLLLNVFLSFRIASFSQFHVAPAM